MAKVTINIEGTAEEVQQALRTLVGAMEVAGGPAEAVAAVAPWTPDEARRLWRELAPEARRILQELARRSEGYPQSNLSKALGLSPREIGGRLSSVGHAMRKLPNKPHPVVRERLNGELVYRLDREVAQIVQNIAAAA